MSPRHDTWGLRLSEKDVGHVLDIANLDDTTGGHRNDRDVRSSDEALIATISQELNLTLTL